jgi:hypothetical protein
MEFRYHVTGPAPDLPAIESAIAALDPAVLLDADASGRAVRISTTLDEFDLLACLRRAGDAAAPAERERVRSEWWGGCGG